MSPKAGRVRIGSLVKLYYITEDILEESKALLLSKSEKSKARQQRLTEVLSTPSQLLKKIEINKHDRIDHAYLFLPNRLI